MLQRAGHKAVLGFHCIILSPRAFGIVTRPLALERPLALQQPGLLFDLAQRGDRQGDLIRRKGGQDQPLDFVIDQERTHLLATRLSLRAVIGNAHVDRVVAMRPGITQTHPPGAAAASDDTLQQSSAFSRNSRMVFFISDEVVRELSLDGHELFPVHVCRVGILETNRPILRRDSHRSDPAALGMPPHRVRLPPSVHVGASIGRILQNMDHTCTVRRLPDDVMWRRAMQRSHRQQQIAATQISHHRLGAAQLSKLRKHQSDPLLHLFVRVERHAAVAAVRQASRKRQPQLATRRLLSFALVQTDLDLMQFGLAHDPRQPKQQPIVICRRIIQSFSIGDQHAEQRTQFQKLMPVAVVSCQS